MITNRRRGLIRIHAGVVVLAVSVFFWVYAELIMRYVPIVRLSREVNLLPYFLCVVIGLLLGDGRIRQFENKITRLTLVDAAMLATTQTAFVAFAVFAMMFATLDRDMSRLFLGTFLVWTWLGLLVAHQRVPRRLASALYGRDEAVPTLLVGRLAALPTVQSWLAQRSHLGVHFAGFVALDLETASGGGQPVTTSGGAKPLTDAGMKALTAPVRELAQILETRGIGQVIMIDLPADEATTREIIEHCQARGCRLLIQHKINEIVGHPVVSVDEGGYHFLALHREPLEEPLHRALKRVFDIVVALPVVVGVLPGLMAVVWFMQRRQAPGPLFHVRARSGEGRVEFPMLKFRSMRVRDDADAGAEAQQARADDARVYPFGRFLRRHSLDEFPQFWNVLIGDMSVVGPRPVMPLLDAEFARQVRAYRSKHWVKPGITGLAQSEGFRGEIQTPEQLQERIRLDLHYIAHWSIWLDVQIALRTFWQVFFPPKSAY